MTAPRQEKAAGVRSRAASNVDRKLKLQFTRAKHKRQHAGLTMLDHLFGRRQGGEP